MPAAARRGGGEKKPGSGFRRCPLAGADAPWIFLRLLEAPHGTVTRLWRVLLRVFKAGAAPILFTRTSAFCAAVPVPRRAEARAHCRAILFLLGKEASRDPKCTSQRDILNRIMETLGFQDRGERGKACSYRCPQTVPGGDLC